MEKNLEEINELLKSKTWTGYIWYVSDVNPNKAGSKPKKYTNKAVPKIKIEGHNHIQELYLFDGKDTAIHSKYLGDGNQRFFINTLRDLENEEVFKIGEEKEYPSHLNKFGIEKTIFQTIYKKTPSTDGVAQTWEPIVEFFKGLKIKENDKN